MQLHSLYQMQTTNIHTDGVVWPVQEQKDESTILQANILPEELCLTTTQAIKENVSNLETFLKKKKRHIKIEIMAIKSLIT